MLNIICLLTYISSGSPVTDNIEGIIIRESRQNYLVDFTEGLRGKAENPGAYKKVIINKTECVKR